MSTAKRVVLKNPDYTKIEKNRMGSVHRCFHNAMPDEGLPDLLKMNEDFTLSTHHIDEIHTKKATWIADIKEHGYLQTECDAMIGHLCSYLNVRWKRKFGRNGNTNDPYNLVCYELLTWLTTTLSRAPCSQVTLDMVKKRCDYLNNLLNSGAFKPGRYNKKTMRGTLIRVKNILEGRVTLAIKREIANTHAREHLESLQNFGKIILSNGFRFLYHIFNNTENTPPPNITRFRRLEEDYKSMYSTRIGELLTTMVESPHFSPFFLEEHQKKGSSAVASLQTVNTSGKPRTVSLRALQTFSNPFLDSSNKPCAPRALNKNQNIQEFLNPPSDTKQKSKVDSVGIYSPLQQNPELIEAYIDMHAILVELAKIFLACDEAKALAGLGGDLLVYGISHNQINRLMDTLTKLCTKLLTCQTTLVTLCDKIYEPLTHKNKTTEAKNVSWVKNYEKIASLQGKLEKSVNNCIAQASLVKEKSKIIPVEERLKYAQNQTKHFARSTEELNHQVEYFLKREPTPALPSQQSTWKSAQLKHTPQGTSSNALNSTPQIEVLEEDEPQPAKQLQYSLRTSLSNLRNLLRTKKALQPSDAEQSEMAQANEQASSESKPHLSRSLRTSKSKLSAFTQSDASPGSESTQETTEATGGDNAITAGTSPRKQQLNSSFRKSFTKLFRLTGSGQNSASPSDPNSAQNSPQLPRARRETISGVSEEPTFGNDTRKIQRGNSALSNTPVARGRSGTVSGQIACSPKEAQSSPTAPPAAVRKKGTDSVQSSPMLSRAHPPATVNMLEPPKDPPCKKIELFGDAANDQFLDDDSAPAMLELFLETAPEATEIHLQRNRLTGIGAVHLCNLLSKHGVLEKFNCSSNKALLSWCASEDLQFKGWAPAKALCQLIENHSCLKELNISDCGLTSEGVQWLAKGLRNNTSLEFLDLSDNPIDARGINTLCDAIRHHPHLQNLIIIGIQLNDDCGQELCRLLEDNTNITFLGVNEANNFSEATTLRIYDLLKKNRSQNTASMKM